MTMTMKRRIATAATGLLATAAAWTGLGVGQAAALDNPVVTNPSGNLTTGQTITVKLSGLAVGQQHYVAICNGDGAAGAPACNTAAGEFANITPTQSTATVQFRVRKSYTAASHGGTPGITVNCKGTTGTQCYVVVTQHSVPFPSKGTAVTFN